VSNNLIISQCRKLLGSFFNHPVRKFLVALFLCAVIPAVSSAVWTTETVDAPKSFAYYYPRAIATDSLNHPHIAYGGDHLYHTYFDGAQWQYEIVDSSPGVGIDASIAIDSNGNVHISYYDETNDTLKYATNASGSWVTETVDSSGSGVHFFSSDVHFTSIAIDSDNKVHISYYLKPALLPVGSYNIKYATNASGSWVTETIDNVVLEQLPPSTISIGIDSSKNVHISYETAHHGLKYATNASGSWVTEIVPANSGDYNSIVIDSNDKVHIINATALDINHVTNASGSWVTETVVSGVDAGYLSMGIDSDDKLHISYFEFASGRDLNYATSDLKYATNASGSWVIKTIDRKGTVGLYTSLYTDSNNKVHISYFDYTNSNLKYATNASGSWVTKSIDRTNSVGEYTSIAISPSNKVHISYHAYSVEEGEYDVIKYATNLSGSWITETVDKGDLSTSIAVDSNDKVYISYVSVPNDIKYATNASGSWVTETVYSGGIDQHTSIALDSNNKAHISFANSDGDLMHATNASGSWVIETINRDCFGPTSIAIDSNNKVHISYRSSAGTLKYTTNASGSWVNKTVDSTVYNVSLDHAIAVDSKNKAHISYSGYNGGIYENRYLKYATNASGSWVTETVDSEGDVGQCNLCDQNSSIAIDSRRKAHISYYNGHLKYATNASGSWVTETVDSEGDVGQYSSTAIDKSNQIHISYFDFSNKDLKHAINKNVKLLSPNGGEAIPSGSTYNITWESIPEAVSFKIMYSMDNGITWKLIDSGIIGASYEWTVPTPKESKKKCLLKVIGYNGSNTKVGKDISDAPFTIEVVKLTSPNGGETLTSGDSLSITWTTNDTKNPVEKVILFYTKNGGVTWKPITTITDSNPGSFDWTVPTVIKEKTTCKVKVILKDANDKIVGSDISDYYFVIQPAP
jgi:hypothetical protein